MKDKNFFTNLVQYNPYIIAEIGVNHENSIDSAFNLIESAKKGGASAVKFQSYKAKSLAIKNSPAYWDTNKEKTKNQYELFKKFELFGKDEYVKLNKYCEQLKIDFLSTPFDNNAVDYLKDLVPFFKVSSSDITNYLLIKKIIDTKKPILLSTGASELDEIQNTINFIKENGCSDISIMHCILSYPTLDIDANLSMIESLKANFPEIVIGYSDHVKPDSNMLVLTTSYLLGARIIEKHFTLDKNLQGNDHYHSMDEKDLKFFVSNINKINTIKGNKTKKECIDSEKISRQNARRSLVADKDIMAGETISLNNISAKRPGLGVSPIYYKNFIGKKAKRNIKQDSFLRHSDIE